MQRPEKHRIRSAFDRAAASYDAAAVLQRAVCARLLALRPEASSATPHILDAGCGTGYGARLLRERWPQARISAADFAASMVARTAADGIDCVLADIEALPFRPACFDGYWSSLTVQWCDNRRVLAEAARVLKPNGWLALSTLGEDTYRELRSAFAGIDRHQHTLDFSAADQLADAAHAARLQQVSLHRETITLHYPDLRSLLGAVKAIGANALGPGRRSGMMGKAAWAALSSAYEQHRTAAGLPASYDVILLSGHK
ncbi:MAG: malonyl-ACP O-methyltransferase BioC [Betaproteobacteria bacterium]|uniref:Malonyl-[acyl-carrier protein] O-methyltransferase n=1 Tax=Candidatus Proximibacter danicus TaxID=2954365 RepID=A0A9D7PRH3_9PROT|nr:malonyl-ACP O-methyltransferase BioC [Candidatus Proximibacter danicus]